MTGYERAIPDKGGFMADSNKNCAFCRIVEKKAPGKIVYEDSLVVAFEDIHPRAPSHVLIVPRKHIESLSEMTVEDEALVGHMHRVAADLARQWGPNHPGYRTVINTGAQAGQTVFHLHVHVLGGRYFSWPPG